MPHVDRVWMENYRREQRATQQQGAVMSNDEFHEDGGTVYHKSPGLMPRIDQIWMVLSVDELGNEGVCAHWHNGNWMPLIAADAERLAYIEKQAEKLASNLQMKIVVARLSLREDIRVIDSRQ
jgi:hypothetical protein